MLLASACSLHPRKVKGPAEDVVTLVMSAHLEARFDGLMLPNHALAVARQGE